MSELDNCMLPIKGVYALDATNGYNSLKPLTEGDTSPFIGGSPHTAVFSIRTEVRGSTIQNNAKTTTF